MGIWLRVSTEMQVQGDSPERHEERARAYCLAQGWQVAEVYRLDAVSGKSVMGHSMTLKMLRDVRAGRIQALVFSKLARLARNTRELLEIADDFQKQGADLVSLEECIDTSTPVGRVFFTMIAAMAQWEREEISARIAASVPGRARMGRSTGGMPVYGYHWVEGKLVPHPEEAAVRRLMFDLYLEHRRYLRVANILNERGYRTRQGNQWTTETIKLLLKDPTAKGERRANFTRRTALSTKEFKDPSEWVIVPVEPIVSDDVWNECSRIINETKYTHAPHLRKGRTPKYLFSGLVFCGGCGNHVKMYPQTGTPHYRCFKCSNRIPKDDLEALFVEQVSDFLLDKEKISEYLQDASFRAGEKRGLIESQEKERDRTRRRIEALVDLYQQGAVGLDEFKRQCRPLEDKLGQIEEEVLRLDEEADALEAELPNTTDLAREGTKLVSQWGKLPEARRREVVEQVLLRVTVDRSEVEFELRHMPEVDGKMSHRS